MREHYDSYGIRGREVYEGAPMGLGTQIPYPSAPRVPERRFMIWVHDTPDSGTGFRKTYRTKFFAIRKAQLLQEMGYGVVVVDRKILPGDTGFCAHHDHSYLMEEDGTLRIGTFDEIQELRKDRRPSHSAFISEIGPGESAEVELG